MSNSLNSKWTQDFIDSNSSEEFLAKVYLSWKMTIRNISLDRLAEKNKIPRSTFYALVSGDRKVTLNHLDNICQAFEFSKLLSEAFNVLVEAEQLGFTGERRKRLESVRMGLVYSLKHKNVNIRELKSQTWPKIYACLGSLKKGQSFEQIQKMSDLPSPVVKLALDHMIDIGVVFFDTSILHYFATESLLSIRGLGEDIDYQELFLKELGEVRQKVQHHFDHAEYCFIQSFFSINIVDLPKIASELRDLLAGYVESANDDDGERVAKLTVALTRE